jgi:hypothetical protein
MKPRRKPMPLGEPPDDYAYKFWSRDRHILVLLDALDAAVDFSVAAVVREQ